MGILSYLLQPDIFYGILAGIFILSLIIVFVSWLKKRKTHKSNSRNNTAFEKRIEELETLLLAKEGENKNSATNMEAVNRTKENESRKIIAELRQELSLKTKMYEGLKSQYEELEKSLEQEIKSKSPKSAS